MKKRLKNWIKSIINKAKSNWRIADLLSDQPVLSEKEFGRFVNSVGYKHALIAGLRDQLKPGWRSMFVPDSKKSTFTQPMAAKKALYGYERIYKTKCLLKKTGIEFDKGTALEFGCYDGKDTYGLLAHGFSKVVGSDIINYTVLQKHGSNHSQNEVITAETQMTKVRNMLKMAFLDAGYISETSAENINFIEEDIADSQLEESSFQWIFSWETLEHVINPEKMINNIARLLSPGGIFYSIYNPFFCLTGGHSLCTLDFLWGHARLSRKDFLRYLDEFRPDEKDLAMNFFISCLNRMSLADLRQYITQAGLEEVLLLPIPNEGHLAIVPEEALLQVQRYYPTVTLADLISPSVHIVARKPK